MGCARKSSLILGAIYRNVEPGPFDLRVAPPPNISAASR